MNRQGLGNVADVPGTCYLLCVVTTGERIVVGYAEDDFLVSLFL